MWSASSRTGLPRHANATPLRYHEQSDTIISAAAQERATESIFATEVDSIATRSPEDSAIAGPLRSNQSKRAKGQAHKTILRAAQMALCRASTIPASPFLSLSASGFSPPLRAGRLHNTLTGIRKWSPAGLYFPCSSLPPLSRPYHFHFEHRAASDETFNCPSSGEA